MSQARTPSEHPNPPQKNGSKMGGAPTPKWDPIGFDPQPEVQAAGLDVAVRVLAEDGTLAPSCPAELPPLRFHAHGKFWPKVKHLTRSSPMPPYASLPVCLRVFVAAST